MPQLIEHIDQITNRLARNILRLSSGDRGGTATFLDNEPDADYDWEAEHLRNGIFESLVGQGTTHAPCTLLSIWRLIRNPYGDPVVLDVPDDPSRSNQRMLVEHLERKDESSRNPDIGTYIVWLHGQNP
jgi:hypothetical protein